MIIKGCWFIEESLVNAEWEEGEKVKCKIYLAGAGNPSIQQERRKHWLLFQWGLIRIKKKIIKKIIFSILSPERP